MLQLDADFADKLSRRLRKITQRLGKVRELDVLIGVVSELKESGRASDAGLARVGAAIEADRRRTRERHIAKSQLGSSGGSPGSLKKSSGSSNGTERQNARPPLAAEPHVERAPFPPLGDRRTHRTSRIDAQSVRLRTPAPSTSRTPPCRAYRREEAALRVGAVHELAGLKPSAELRLLRRIQDVLGRLHDLQVLIDRIRQAQASLIHPTSRSGANSTGSWAHSRTIAGGCMAAI